MEADVGANRQAFVVVVLSGAAVGVGGIANSGPEGILWQALVAVVGWWIWAYATYFIGTRLLPTAETVADPGQLLRTIGFSGAPGILRVAMLVPAIAFPAFVVGTLWELVAMVVAVRQALDYREHAARDGGVRDRLPALRDPADRLGAVPRALAGVSRPRAKPRTLRRAAS